MFKRITKIILWIFCVYFLCRGVSVLFRIFICDQFIVPSNSMEPTLIPGDRILVNKLIFGARIYKKLDFGKNIPLESKRMPRLRCIKPNDIVVFNAPQGYDRNRIEFKINYVYAKRCIGTPGDIISIRDSYFYNNNYPLPIGDTIQQQHLALIPDSLFSENIIRAFPFDDKCFSWTIKNLGPLYIPRKGDTIRMTLYNYKLYGQIIEYETRNEPQLKNDTIYINDTPVIYYTFKNNYYYFCGDNVINSKDSRYLGFVPEEFIIGVACRISYSRDIYSNVFRWQRLWKNIIGN